MAPKPPPPLSSFGNPIFASLFEFPQKVEIDELKKEGKFDEKTLVEIKDSWLRPLNTTVWWQRKRIKSKIIPCKICSFWVFIGTAAGLGAGFIIQVHFLIILGFYLGWLWGIILEVANMTFDSKILGEIEASPAWAEFMDKFTKPWWQKMDEKVIKCLTLGKVSYRGNWLIEYGFLLAAYQWHKKDYNDFKDAVSKARNKKEFQWAAGIN